MSNSVVVAVLLSAIFATNPAHASDEPLRIVIVDGQVLFAGANLDIDELRVALAKTGRQDEVLTFQVGPNAKSTYIAQVLKAVRDAGYSKLSIVGPGGGRPAVTVDPQGKFD